MQVEHPTGEIITSVYDPDGHRVAQDDGVAAQQFVYDGNNLLQERDDVGTVEADYTYVPQEYARYVSQQRDAESRFYHVSGIQDVTQLTDAGETVTDDYRFDAWGKPLATTGSTENPHTYKGEAGYQSTPQLSAEESTYYLHHRVLPSQGRFLSEDPLDDDANAYRYVRNNPVNAVDPSGLEEFQVGPDGATLTRRYSTIPGRSEANYLNSTRRPRRGKWSTTSSTVYWDTRSGQQLIEETWTPLDEGAATLVEETQFIEWVERTEVRLLQDLSRFSVKASELSTELGKSVWLADGGNLGKTYVQDINVGDENFKVVYGPAPRENNAGEPRLRPVVVRRSPPGDRFVQGVANLWFEHKSEELKAAAITTVIEVSLMAIPEIAASRSTAASTRSAAATQKLDDVAKLADDASEVSARSKPVAPETPSAAPSNSAVPPSVKFYVNEHGVAFSKRAYELGFDLKTGFRPNEGLGGSRLERQIGRPLERYIQDEDFDFIDRGELGGRISLKGPLVTREGRLLPANEINKQLNSLVDKALRDAHPTSGATAVAVDLFGLSPQQITQVKTAISKGLPPNANRIVYIE